MLMDLGIGIERWYIRYFVELSYWILHHCTVLEYMFLSNKLKYPNQHLFGDVFDLKFHKHVVV